MALGAQTSEPELFAEFTADLGEPIEIGRMGEGMRSMSAIQGGHVRGACWTGCVVPGTAAYQVVVQGTLSDIRAMCVVQSDTGEVLYVKIRAKPKSWSDADLVQRVKPASSFICLSLVADVTTTSARFGWVNKRRFSGFGVWRPQQMEMKLFLAD